MRAPFGRWVPACAGTTALGFVIPAYAGIQRPALAPPPAATQPAAPAARPSLAEPSLAPDGQTIAFVSGGDVWTVPAAGGEARLLVAHPATESRPLWSPDGRRLAFVSTRTGGGDVYVLELASGAVTRVTYDDAPEALDGWSADGRWIYLSTAARDVAGMQDVLRVRSTGGTPMPVAADRYASEYWAAPAPDGGPSGGLVAVTARGLVSGQWWRHGHSHIDESEVWLVRPNASLNGTPSYAQVTAGGAKSAWPMWAPDGRTLYFMSDRGGPENLWAQPVDGGRAAGAPRRLTSFADGRVLWPSLRGRTIVFERDFGIWRADAATGQASPVPITLVGAPAGTAVERLSLTTGFQELALSPDGRKLAFTARGAVFAAVARDATAPGGPAAGGDAVRVTTAPGPQEGLAWSPDSRRVAYAAQRDGRWRLASYDFATRRETLLTGGGAPNTAPSAPTGLGSGGDLMPRWAPDGRAVAFVRDGRELRVVYVDAAGAPRAERLVATATFERPPFADPHDLAWSPDGRWIAYLAPSGPQQFSNVQVVPAAGGAAPRAVTGVPNANAGDVAWSPDGTALYFVTGQRTEQGQVARVDLVPRAPRFREDQFQGLFGPVTPQQPGQPQPVTPGDSTERRPARDAARARTDSLLARAPGDSARDAARGDSARAGTARRSDVRVDFAGIRQRLAYLPLGLDVQSASVSPDGRTLLLVAQAAGQTNLWTWSLDELAREAPVARQLTSTGTPKADAQWAPDSKEVYFRDGGRIAAVTVESRAVRPVAVTADLDVDFAREKLEVFREAWTYLRDHFYDERFHGANWDAVRARVGPQAAGARTPDELRRVLNLMVGELDASHLGAGAPGGGPPVTGRLGVRWEAAAYERDGVLRAAEVVPLGPAALAGVRPGDAVVAVDGRALGPADNLDERLAYTVGRRVVLTVAGAAGARRDGGTRLVPLRPVSLAAEKRLVYRAWVESRRAYVDSASGGRLGYVHMPDMSAESLQQLYADLDADNQARQGVVVDIRNNNGGFVNAYALDVFARRPYLTMRQRGREATPARTALGQRSLERPTVLVVNQHSLSDAEDFTEGYRALRVGQVVGEPTAGWIIFTWGTALVDGTTFRLPRTRITGADGTDMERHPRPVDVAVTRPMGESYTGRDSQLDAAVRVLLGAAGASAAGGGR